MGTKESRLAECLPILQHPIQAFSFNEINELLRDHYDINLRRVLVHSSYVRPIVILIHMPCLLSILDPYFPPVLSLITDEYARDRIENRGFQCIDGSFTSDLNYTIYAFSQIEIKDVCTNELEFFCSLNNSSSYSTP